MQPATRHRLQRVLLLGLGLRLAGGALLLAAGAGCAKRTGPTGVPAAGDAATTPLEPLRVSRQDLSDGEQRKLHIQLVVPATASDAQIDRLIERLADAETDQEGELWVSVFLEGMDPNSVAYALGIRRPGGTIAISHRESLQTYR